MFLGLSPSVWQYLLVPEVVVGLLTLPILGLRMPKYLGMLALLGIALSCVAAFSVQVHEKPETMVATLSQDSLEVESYKLRKEINSFLHGEDAPAAERYFQPLSSGKEAVQLLHNRPSLKALVWGSENWLNVSMPERPAYPLSASKLAQSFPVLHSLKLVTAVPGFGIAYQPRTAAAQFIADTLAALQLIGEPLHTQQALRAELLLLDAANIISPWSAQAHRAVPWWLLGNLYLQQVLIDARYERGTVDCAIEAFHRARSYLNQYDVGSSDLYAAVYNNLAVAIALQGVAEGDPQYQRSALSYLKVALEVRNAPNVYDLKERPLKIVKGNRVALTRALHKERTSRQSLSAEDTE